MKIVKDKIVSEMGVTQYMSTTFEGKKGKQDTWEWIKRKSDKESVVTIAMVGDKLLVIKEYRVPIKGTLIQLPSGTLEEGELPEVAATRELKEETGLSVKKILKKATPPLYSSAGITNERTHLIFVEAEGTLSTKGNEDTEKIKPILLSRKEASDILDNIEKNPMGSKTYLVLLRFVEEGKITS